MLNQRDINDMRMVQLALNICDSTLYKALLLFGILIFGVFAKITLSPGSGNFFNNSGALGLFEAIHPNPQRFLACGCHRNLVHRFCPVVF